MKHVDLKVELRMAIADNFQNIYGDSGPAKTVQRLGCKIQAWSSDTAGFVCL